MPLTVRDVGQLTPTSSGSSVTVGLGHLDDATSLVIYVSSSAGTASTGATPLQLQVAMFDIFDSTAPTSPGAGVSFSTNYYTYSLYTTGGIPTLSTGQAFTVPSVPFRSIRLVNMTSAVNAEVVAWVTKQITV